MYSSLIKCNTLQKGPPQLSHDHLHSNRHPYLRCTTLTLIIALKSYGITLAKVVVDITTTITTPTYDKGSHQLFL